MIQRASLRWSLAPGCVLMLSACCGQPLVDGWVGPSPPKISIPGELPAALLAEPLPRLTWWKTWPGFITTPMFKMLGVFGWDQTGFEATMEGIVDQAAWSTDGFTTVDVRLSNLRVGETPVPILDTRFLRAEICCHAVTLPLEPDDLVSHFIVVSGRFVWDRDGWYEIHPQKEGDVIVKR